MAGLSKRTLLIVITLGLGAALVTGWLYRRREVVVRLAPTTEEAVPRQTLPLEPLYLQADPKWANDLIGGSREPMRSVGCTLCCLSMALAHHGIALDPATLNQKLQVADGFTERGFIKWDAVRAVTEGKAQVEVPSNPTHREINTALASGQAVLVKVWLASGFHHWVLLVGRDQKQYLMKDPLGDGKSLLPLSSLGSDILAVRIVRKR